MHKRSFESLDEEEKQEDQVSSPQKNLCTQSKVEKVEFTFQFETPYTTTFSLLEHLATKCLFFQGMLSYWSTLDFFEKKIDLSPFSSQTFYAILDYIHSPSPQKAKQIHLHNDQTDLMQFLGYQKALLNEHYLFTDEEVCDAFLESSSCLIPFPEPQLGKTLVQFLNSYSFCDCLACFDSVCPLPSVYRSLGFQYSKEGSGIFDPHFQPGQFRDAVKAKWTYIPCTPFRSSPPFSQKHPTVQEMEHALFEKGLFFCSQDEIDSFKAQPFFRKLVCAGGLIHGCYCNQICDQSDVDVFFLESDPLKMEQCVFEFLSFFERLSKQERKVRLTNYSRTETLIYFQIHSLNSAYRFSRTIQIILKPHVHVESLLLEFDLDLCQIAYTQGQFIASPRFINYAHLGVSLVHPSFFQAQTFARILKYSTRNQVFYFPFVRTREGIQQWSESKTTNQKQVQIFSLSSPSSSSVCGGDTFLSFWNKCSHANTKKDYSKSQETLLREFLRIPKEKEPIYQESPIKSLQDILDRFYPHSSLFQDLQRFLDVFYYNTFEGAALFQSIVERLSSAAQDMFTVVDVTQLPQKRQPIVFFFDAQSVVQGAHSAFSQKYTCLIPSFFLPAATIDEAEAFQKLLQLKSLHVPLSESLRDLWSRRHVNYPKSSFGINFESLQWSSHMF